jgi:hypothetical protein
VVAITERPEIPGLLPRDVAAIIERAVAADGVVCEPDASRLFLAEICEIEALVQGMIADGNSPKKRPAAKPANLPRRR